MANFDRIHFPQYLLYHMLKYFPSPYASIEHTHTPSELGSLHFFRRGDVLRAVAFNGARLLCIERPGYQFVTDRSLETSWDISVNPAEVKNLKVPAGRKVINAMSSVSMAYSIMQEGIEISHTKGKVTDCRVAQYISSTMRDRIDTQIMAPLKRLKAPKPYIMISMADTVAFDFKTPGITDLPPRIYVSDKDPNMCLLRWNGPVIFGTDKYYIYGALMGYKRVDDSLCDSRALLV